MTKATHVVCDCDGVLVDSETVASEALLVALGQRFPEQDLRRLVELRLGMTTVGLVTDLAAELGVVITLDEIAVMQEDIEAAVRAHQQAIPGVAEALALLPLPIAVASNSSLPRVRIAVKVAGVEALVGSRLYTADIVGKPKPAPDVYLAAAAGFGVAPAQCVAVEDSIVGATAAVAAGMQVLGFAGGLHITAGTPGHAEHHRARLRAAGVIDVFEDMRELPQRILALM